MRYRTIRRLDWPISEIGYGMWGMGSWAGSDDEESLPLAPARAGPRLHVLRHRLGLRRGAERAAAGRARAREPGPADRDRHEDPARRTSSGRRAAAIPSTRPSRRPHPRVHREEPRQPRAPAVDLLQFHVWEDAWADDDGWQRAVDDLQARGPRAARSGVSLNRWEPWNVLRTLRTGLVDTVQVIYNIFDQAPEDELFPLCRELGVGVIARVPFDEGTLTGTLTLESTWPEDDWRSTYFVPENLASSVAHAEALRPMVPEGMTMPELALRFILSNPDVTTVIPGMRAERHVEATSPRATPDRCPRTARAAARASLGPRADRLVTVD